MKSSVRKFLSIAITAAVVAGWIISVFGLGPVKNIKDSLKYGLDINGGVNVVMEADTEGLSGSKLASTMEQTREVLERRVDAMGVANATVRIEGDKRIRVEMPGVEDAESAIERIGQTAQLKFTLGDGTIYLTGSDVSSAAADVDNENGGYKIVLKFTDEGRSKFAKATELAASGNVVPAVTFPDGTYVSANSVVIWLDDDILTAPAAAEKIDSDSCEITQSGGGMSKTEATETSALIRGGALPLSLKEVNSSVQTATVGSDALDKSVIAGGIGLLLVFILMLVTYNVLGLFADIALALYVLIVLWAMVGLNAVLTLPGIAGIILGIGMAVDANVIIFARIREELGQGRSIRMAVDQGFRHALVTILDSQITTFIATVILYEFGSATVKGFALTLMISIFVSILTAVVVTQLFVGTLADSPKMKPAYLGCNEDGTPKHAFNRNFKFIEHRKIFYIISAAVIITGILFMGFRGFNYGIDFTGGTMIQMDLGKKVPIASVEKTIEKFELDPTVIYAGQDEHQVIIQTGKALDNKARSEIQDAVSEEYNLKDDAVISSEEFSPTFGEGLRQNAVKSILIAALGMLVYIILRFRSWKYGVAAVAGLAHDVLVLLGVYAVFGITMNNPFVAAVLTIVGYSINDTIVVFDRVRENMRLMRGQPVADILNRSINQTMGRSFMTSLTTLVAIIPLMVMVSSSLAGFVLPLMVGVAVGTYSSIALCSPLFYEFSKRQEISEYRRRQQAGRRIEARKEKEKREREEEKEAARKAARKKKAKEEAEQKRKADNSAEEKKRTEKSDNKGGKKRSGIDTDRAENNVYVKESGEVAAVPSEAPDEYYLTGDSENETGTVGAVNETGTGAEEAENVKSSGKKNPGESASGNTNANHGNKGKKKKSKGKKKKKKH